MELPHLLELPRIHPTVFIQPGVILVGDVQVGAHSSIWFNSVVRGDVHRITIGERVNLQDFCMIHVSRGRYPVTIGDEVSLGHRVTLHGCILQPRVLIGMGAIVMDGAEVGEESIVGAGSLVTEGTVIPPGSLAIGSPARVKRPLRLEERLKIRDTAAHYVEYAQAWRDAGHPSLILGPHGRLELP